MKSSNLTLASRLSFAVFGLTALSATAFAQTATPTVEMANLLSQDIDQTIEFKTSVPNPFAELVENMGNSLNITNEDGSGPTEEQKETVKQLLAKNTITIATKNTWKTTDGYSYPEVKTMVAFHISAEDLDKLMAMTGTPGVEMINGVKVYVPTDSSQKFIGLFGDLAVVAESREDMNTLINNYKNPSTALTLAKNSDYQQISAKTLGNSFLTMYVNPAQYSNLTEGSAGLNEMFGLESLMAMEKDLMAAMKGEGISVAQSDNGFNFSLFVKGDLSKLTQLNLRFDRYNFLPELYKYANAKNIMMFGEENNFQGKLNDIMKLFLADSEAGKAFTEWKNAMKAEGNVDFDNDILPLLSGKYTMTIHKTEQLWPAVTLVVDVRNMRDKAGSVLGRVVDYADKFFNSVEKENGNDIYNRDVASFNGTAYYRMTFDPSKDPQSGLEMVAREKSLITIQTAVTSEGMLVITTSPSVADVYTLDGKGMMMNSTFNSKFSPDTNVSGLAFVSVDAVQDYANMFMDLLGAPEDAHGFLNGLLDPWHDIYGAGYATADAAWGNGTVNVEKAGLEKYGELFEKYFPAYNYDYSDYEDHSRYGTFCDVASDDWFSPYVEDLSGKGIINGYGDGCFRPANEITRAEFLKLVMETNRMNGVISSANTSTANGFTDVGSDEWFAPYVNEAVDYEVVGGYPDRTFRPNGKITRAEAVSILYRTLYTLNVLPDEQKIDSADLEKNPGNYAHFTDVKTGDWFFVEVAAAVKHGLVSGVTSTRFEPNRNLNRAEAAKMIHLLYELEAGNTYAPVPASPTVAPVPPLAPSPSM